MKIPLRHSVILNTEIDNDKYCFPWLKLSSPHPSKNSHPNTVSYYRNYLKELNTDGFDFTNGFERSDVHKFEKLKNLSISLVKSSFYQDQKN